MTDLVRLQIQERDGVVIAHVAGELDIAGAPRTSQAIGDAVPTTARGLVIDFTGLDFIDSSGVAMLFNLARQLGGRRQQLRVVAPGVGAVSRVLEIVEFGRAAPIDDDVERALAEIE
jgi:anti-anti-sigma factor